MKLAIIVGTRPEIIKMSSIIREYEHSDLDYFILHSSQHYSYNIICYNFNLVRPAMKTIL